MSNVAIRINDLSKRYRDKRFRAVHAVKSLSLEVTQGEAFGFVGPNGAGKTSTIKIMMGLNQGDGGRVELFGVDARQPEARKRIAYVPENLYLYDYLSPLEFLLMGARAHQVDVADLKAHCIAWLERFGIAHVARKKIRTFSKGMTQRTALAHAMASQPRLLILDEPLSGLDPVGRKLVVDILNEYKLGGGTIFFSSHILHDVERLGDRFGIIHQGELRTISSPQELIGGEHEGSVRVIVVGKQAPEGFKPIAAGKWEALIDRADLWNALDSLRLGGYDILQIEPGGISLEEAFMSYIARL